MEKLKVTLVVLPWTILDTPALGVHLLQANVSKEISDVSVYYSDMTLAKKIGINNYRYIAEELLSQYDLIQERLFVHLAYPDMPFLGRRTDLHGCTYLTPRSEFDKMLNWALLESLKKALEDWVEETASYLASLQSKIIGFSISHQQTNAGISLINALKKLDPTKIILVGGSNCDGEMAEGILSLSSNIDFIFSGKSEVSFRNFIDNYYKNKILPKTKIITSKKSNINNLFIPNYKDYFEQIKHHGLILNHWINMESSRGCWWGQKRQCGFCGVNGSEKGYAAKLSHKIYEEIVELSEKYNVKNIRMVDTLMPKQYIESLLPSLNKLNLNIFYEQRADLTFEEVKTLKDAGINSIQVGIEALSTDYLNLLNKGVNVRDNINILRYTMILNIVNRWNLLYGIPNESVKGWEATLNILPYITHLPPPSYLRPIEIARFSPYFSRPSDFNIKDLSYFQVYDDIFPQFANKAKLSWLFTGNYPRLSEESVLFGEIRNNIHLWIDTWKCNKSRHVLMILESNDTFVLVDSRNIDTKGVKKITKEQASVALLGEESPYFKLHKDWALTNKIGIMLDGLYVALCTCQSDLYLKLDKRKKILV